MLNLLRAEWTKTAGNRWASGFLIWVFPVGAFAFVVVTAVLVVLVPSLHSADSAQRMGLNNVQWTDQAMSVWEWLNSLMGRVIMLALTSIVFAGEYQWQTWKNIIPRRSRIALILVKFVTVGLFVLFAFTLMSAIYGAGMVVITELAGGTHGPRLSIDVIQSFLRDYARYAALAFTLTMIAASFSALAAMVMRSIIGGVVVGVVATYAEGLSVLLLLLIGRFLAFPKIVYLYRATPSYNVANVKSWLMRGAPEAENLSFLGDVVDFSDGMAFSVVLLAAWVCLLVGSTVFLFHRQDIT